MANLKLKPSLFTPCPKPHANTLGGVSVNPQGGHCLMLTHLGGPLRVWSQGTEPVLMRTYKTVLTLVRSKPWNSRAKEQIYVECWVVKCSWFSNKCVHKWNRPGAIFWQFSVKLLLVLESLFQALVRSSQYRVYRGLKWMRSGLGIRVRKITLRYFAIGARNKIIWQGGPESGC